MLPIDMIPAAESWMRNDRISAVTKTLVNQLTRMNEYLSVWMLRMIRPRVTYTVAANKVGPRRINTFWTQYGINLPVLLWAAARAAKPIISTK